MPGVSRPVWALRRPPLTGGDLVGVRWGEEEGEFASIAEVGGNNKQGDNG